jgi:hypothetical protein
VHSHLFDALARVRIQEHHEAAARLRLAAGSRRSPREPAVEAAQNRLIGRSAGPVRRAPAPAFVPAYPAWDRVSN